MNPLPADEDVDLIVEFVPQDRQDSLAKQDFAGQQAALLQPFHERTKEGTAARCIHEWDPRTRRD
jgi:hypothetical protein